MNKLMITAMVCLFSSIGYSAASSANTSPLSSLGAAFSMKHHNDNTIIINSDDITMGYAGEDVAKRLSLPLEVTA